MFLLFCILFIYLFYVQSIAAYGFATTWPTYRSDIDEWANLASIFIQTRPQPAPLIRIQ